MNPTHQTNPFDQIPAVHALYCRLTGQTLRLEHFGRQRLWYELLRNGFTEKEIERVIKYLQREILQGRRNPGALKLSNLLQPDRFEEDLNLSRVKLCSSPAKKAPETELPEYSGSEEIRRQQCEQLRAFRLRLQNPGATSQKTTGESDSR